MENHIKMDDLGVPLFLETPIYMFLPRRFQLQNNHFFTFLGALLAFIDFEGQFLLNAS